MAFPGKIGRDEGEDRGPKLGDGASISGSVAGGTDVDDATAGPAPVPRKDKPEEETKKTSPTQR